MTMKEPLQKRINIATSWASCRIALLDSIERYEDSYAITEEFREWIISIGSKNNHINSTLLYFPQHIIDSLNKKANETDEFIEL